MIDNLFKSNFIGKDGFRWWIGQVAPKDVQQHQMEQVDKAWGARVKVRILGYHPLDEEELSNEDLPWAHCLLSTQGGTGKGGKSKSLRVQQGDIALGFFLDGDDGQLPVIIGLFANNGARFGGSGKYKSPFEPFTGYTDKIKAGNIIIKNEDGGQSGKKNAKSPRILPKDLTDKLTDKTKEKLNQFINSEETQAGIQQGIDAASEGFNQISEKLPGAIDNLKNDLSDIDVPISKSIGTIASFAGSSNTQKMQNEVKNIGKRMQSLGAGVDKKELLKIKSEASTKLTSLSKKFVGPMLSTTMNDLGPKLNQGLNTKWDTTFTTVLAATQNTSIASKAATAMQRSFLKPIKALSDAFPCAGEKIAESMAGSINDLLTPLMDNVENFVPCIADQFTGAVFNKILGGIDKELGSALGGVSKLLGGFNVIDNLRGKAEGLLGIQEAVGCIIPKQMGTESNFWQIGKGATNVPGIAAETIMQVANIAQEAQEAAASPQGLLGSLISDIGAFDFMRPDVSTAGFSSVLGECYTGPNLNCKGVKVNVFAGDGGGVDARPIIGALVGDTFAEQTGSLIGVQLVNPGNGYTVPPIVEITDTCENGYGAVAEAIIDYDPQSPTYQQVVDIVIVSAGENYPVIVDENGETANQEYTVDHVAVISSGENYQESDVITDAEGNVYTKILDERGRILNVIPPNPQVTNVVPISSIPELIIETETGLGANIKPIITPRPSYQGAIRQVIDCISPRDGIVGFINGDPYYGPFHVHPETGAKMVGVAHTTAPHAIIYDTPAASRSTSAIMASTTTMTTISTPTSTYTPTPTPSTDTASTQTTTEPTTPQSSPPSSPPPSSSPPSSPPSSGGGGYGY